MKAVRVVSELKTVAVEQRVERQAADQVADLQRRVEAAGLQAAEAAGLQAAELQRMQRQISMHEITLGKVTRWEGGEGARGARGGGVGEGIFFDWHVCICLCLCTSISCAYMLCMLCPF